MAHDPSHPPAACMKRISRSAAIGAAAVALLLAPFAPATLAQDDDPLNVVTSFSVLADIVENVGGDHVEVTSLVPIGGDAHTFDPSPDQIATLADADLVVEVGGDFEPWLDDLVESSGTSAPVFEAFPDHHAEDDNHHEGEATPSGEDAPIDDGHKHDGDDHAEEHGDLHAWLDVHNTIHTVENLEEMLAEIDPNNADAYAANAEAYIAKLEELETYILEQSGTLPEEDRLLITTHQSLGPFADAYGYEVAGVLLESDSTEGAEAPASHLAELVGIVQDNGIPAVFPDTPGGGDLLQPLADEAGIDVAPPLYVDTLGEEASGAESYISMMRYNIDTIVSALGE